MCFKWYILDPLHGAWGMIHTNPPLQGSESTIPHFSRIHQTPIYSPNLFEHRALYALTAHPTHPSTCSSGRPPSARRSAPSVDARCVEPSAHPCTAGAVLGEVIAVSPRDRLHTAQRPAARGEKEAAGSCCPHHTPCVFVPPWSFLRSEPQLRMF